MRTSEWIQAGFAVILVLAAWIRPLAPRRRAVIAMLAGFAVAAVLLGRFSVYVLAPRQASILRDWLPVALMLVPYWQTGQFFTGPNQKIQGWLVESDHRLAKLLHPGVVAFGRYTRLSMEWAYSLCYVLPVAGLAVLYAAGMRRYALTYWPIVLLPTYVCYALTPLVPALPPRDISGKASAAGARTKSRVFNLWIQQYASIHAISFPSAHVACALAISFVMLHYVPVAGVVFLVIAIWIGVAAIVGGYHYAVDVWLGAAVALIVLAAWGTHLIPRSLLTPAAIVFTTAL
ncbi:MAG: phosphatase PAP2 family protein [Terracidiphilus sp.]